ncbi:MBL fold metallo-hydrolase [Sphingomonas sp. Root710]|uniref:MBL fold metallo-hydrolase n=1 Tax=Sphingomonas sp. Root710 TaxID=1736594 RepID=UPI0009E8C450|nr:MBL fold metallo-hydrolase [Sphingomonas sp. Root710]
MFSYRAIIAGIVGLAIIILLSRALAQANPYYKGPVSDHFDGQRFLNPGQPSTDRSFGEIWRWQSSRAAAKWPKSVEITPVAPAPLQDKLRITMVGHATTLIQAGTLNILADPVWSKRVSPVSFIGPRRVTAPGIAFDDLPPIHVVLISHNHYDHLDIATLRRLHAKHRPLMIMPLGNDTIVRKAIPGARIVTGDWGSRIPIDASATVTVTRANHWSNRGLRDRRSALWASFLVKTKVGSIWFGGDTGYGDGAVFREIRALYGSPDVALIPIGGYAPRWFMSSQHVDPAEAVQVMRDLDARRAIGIHWGTFQLTDEGREAPREELGEALARLGIGPDRFAAAQPGDVFDVD